MSPDRVKRRWRRLCALVALALCVLGLHFVPTPVEMTGSPPEPEPVRYEENGCSVPDEWRNFPIIASEATRVDGAESVVASGMFSETRMVRFRLADVSVQYHLVICTAGGSACSQDIPRLEHLRFGSVLDSYQSPTVDPGFSCEGCDRKSFALRHSSQGRSQRISQGRSPSEEFFVLTIRHPKNNFEETPVGAFLRAPLPSRPWTPMRRHAHVTTEDQVLLSGSAILSFLLGVVALAYARRFVRAGGILQWREAEIRSGVLHVAGAAPVHLEAHLEAPTTVGSALVDERALGPTLSYRDFASIPARHVFNGSRDAAETRARLAINVAAITLGASIVISLLGYVVYR